MSFFDLDPNVARSQYVDAGAAHATADDLAPGLSAGLLNAIPTGIARPAYAAQGAISRAMIPNGQEFDKVFGTSTAAWLQGSADAADRTLTEMGKDSARNGWAANTLSGLASVITGATLGGAAGARFGAAGEVAGAMGAVGVTSGYETTLQAQNAGIPDEIARSMGIVSGAANAAGLVLPMSVPGAGYALNTAFGAGSMGYFGAINRASMHETLNRAGRPDLAAQYQVFDPGAMLADAVMGAGFGAWARFHAGAPPAPPPKNLEPGVLPRDAVDAATAMNAAVHRAESTLPGTPMDSATIKAHNDDLDLATRQLIEGEPVDLPTRGHGDDGGQFEKHDPEFEASRHVPDEEVNAALQELADQNDQELAAHLDLPPERDNAPAAAAGPLSPAMLRGEIGWAQRGGQLQRSTDFTSSDLDASGQPLIGAGEVIGRTKWVEISPFWPMRPDKRLTEAQAHKAFDKLEAGEKLRPIEQRFVDYAARELERRQAPTEADLEREAIQGEPELTPEERAAAGVDGLTPEARQEFDQWAAYHDTWKDLTDDEIDALSRDAAAPVRGENEGSGSGGTQEAPGRLAEPRPGEGEGESAQAVAQPSVAKKGGYVDDLFGTPLPRPERAAGVTPEPKPEPAREISPGVFGATTRLTTVARIRSGFERVTDAASAAHVFAYLRKLPQENVGVLLLDKDGRPIAVVRHSLGQRAEATVEASSLLGSALKDPRVASIWIAHNHPSNTDRFSPQDAALHNNLVGALEGSRVKYGGFLAIAGRRYVGLGNRRISVNEGGVAGKLEFHDALDAIGDENQTIPARARHFEIPVQERIFSRNGTLGPPIKTSQDTIDLARQISNGEDGVMLINHRLAPVAWLPMPLEALQNIRGPVADHLLNGLESSNAAAMVIVTRKPIDEIDVGTLANLGNFGRAMGTQLLDAVSIGKPGSSAMAARKMPANASRNFREGEGDLLSTYTNDEVRQREEAALALQEKTAAQKKAAELKAKADAERDAFSLTGSDRPADKAGQSSLFEPATEYGKENPLWRSALEDAVAGIRTTSSPAAQWKATIAKIPGVKPAEIEATGLNDWLDMQQGNVTRDQVLQFVRDNGVKVSEKMLGSLSDLEQSRAEAHLSSVRAQRNELRNEIWGSPDELAHVGILHEISDPATRANVGGWAHDATSPTVTPGVKRVALRKLEALPLTPEQLAKVLKWGELAHASDAAERATLGPEAGSPKYSNWQLPGGQNYKELLLTLPSATDRITDAEAERAGMGPHAGYETDAFVSSHFKGVSNILAHVRFNERTDADGKRVLFLEEIQSDWAQKGRAAGFRGPGESVTPFGYPNEFRITQSEHQYHVDSPNGDYHVDIGKGTVESEAAAREYANRYFKQLWEARVRAGRDKVAPAPFVTKTEAWVALALKRMIRYAADNGFDRVAWTNGDQQAARYSLEKHLEEIQTSRRADGLYEVHASDKHGRSVFGSAGYVNVNAQNLEHYVGKEMAQKIIDETPPEGKGAKKWRGLDLKVGGSGMREFYDKILPNIAGDVLKKIGGGKVDESGMVLDTKRGTGQEYVGPTMNEGELDAMIADHSINATMRAQLQDVRARLVMGATFHQAINEEGSIALAEMIGGRMKGVGAPETRQSGFDITPKMVERAQQGMALFEPQPGYGDYPGAPGREISSEQYLKAADQREAEATKSAESATGTAIACALANGVGYA